MNFHWNVQYDYTNGQLGELVDIIIASKAKLFVSAIGVPPKEVIDKLHEAGIIVMKYIFKLPVPPQNTLLTFSDSMVGHPKVPELLTSPKIRRFTINLARY